MNPEANYVDYYCERLAPGPWGEPLNALTNGAFLVAGVALVWLLFRQRSRVPVSLWLLPATTAAVGLCSLAFHVLATEFTAMLDTSSIGVFILVAASLAVHHVFRVSWRWAWLAAPGCLAVATVVVASLAMLGVRPVVGGYLAAMAVLVGFGLATRLAAPAAMRPFGNVLFGAAALFVLSLALRTLDGPLCDTIPVGTHFLWHCLNATVMFLVGFTVIRCWQIARTAPSGS